MSDNSEHWEKKANGWVFLSHSSRDYQDVKIVRNYLEKRGFSALMFYLKSLEDPSKKELTQKLIESEIIERNIFVLCDSQDARNSDWVQNEVNYVKRFPQKIYETIDMENIRYNQYRKYKELSKLKNLINLSSLFFSYVQEDREQVDSIFTFLNQNGFRVFKDTHSIEQGYNSSKIRNAIQETIGKGAVLIFLSNNVLSSNLFWSEKEIALNSRAFIIPILLDNVSLDRFSAFSNLDTSQYINIQNGFSKEEKTKLIELIKNGKT